MKTLYETTATNTGGREGHVSTDDGLLNVDVGKPEDHKTNPEQMFAAGYGTCFNSALQAVLKAAHKEGVESTVKVTVRLVEDPDDKNSVKLDIDLATEIKGLDQAAAEKFTKLAHKHCPYSKAINGNVNVNLSTTVQ